MKVLIAPLNWGLGHAARCLPLIIRHLRAGDEVVVASDGQALSLLRKHFPGLRSIELPTLRLHYSAGKRQVWAMLKAVPRLIVWGWRDKHALRSILKREAFDMIVSDNRFFFSTPSSPRLEKRPKMVYITHQLLIPLPHPYGCLEPVLRKWHRRLIEKYDECWVPDYQDLNVSLSGRLSHTLPLPTNVKYIGPLSRFAERNKPEPNKGFQVVAVLSGLEPQRSLLEEQLITEWMDREEHVLIVRGLPHLPPMNARRHNITLVPYLSDPHLMAFLMGAKKIIARSGYSTIMDLAALGVLDKATLISTPGQPEQEYLAQHLHKTKED